MSSVPSNLPIKPFDGMEFIDSFRVKWVFDGSTECWKRMGVVPDIPKANEIAPGLLSADFKQLLDSIPEKGGHFGIINKPLLALKSFNVKPLLEDKVKLSFRTESGSTIRGNSPFEIGVLKPERFKGKILIFITGQLKGESYLIYDNTESDIFLQGDASRSKKDDEYQIVDPTELNEDGVIAGNIELTSSSIDLECLDNGKIIRDKCDVCGGQIESKLSNNFLDRYCVVVPGCKGAQGDQGPKGFDGKDGTGDGPIGEEGDLGIDAPTDPVIIEDLEVLDIDDVFDTAVVALDVDEDNNRYNVVKAKIRTPSDDDPADQVISNAIARTINFTGEGFGYELLLSSDDPIGTGDVDISFYPQGFSSSPNSSGSAAFDETQINIMKLSDFIDAVIDFWKAKLDEISEDYDFEIKAFIEEKEEAARIILTDLARQVSDCEWELPLEFCLGVGPCLPTDSGASIVTMGAPSSAPVTTTSSSILAENPARRFLSLTNTGATTISVAFGAPAFLGEGITLSPGGSVVLDADGVSTQSVNVISSAPGGVVSFQEGE